MEFDRITAKKSFNGIILIFILYNVLFYLIHEAVSMGYAIYVVGARPDINYEELLNLVFNTGFALIAASTFPTLCHRKRKAGLWENKNHRHKRADYVFCSNAGNTAYMHFDAGAAGRAVLSGGI